MIDIHSGQIVGYPCLKHRFIRWFDRLLKALEPLNRSSFIKDFTQKRRETPLKASTLVSTSIEIKTSGVYRLPLKFLNNR